MNRITSLLLILTFLSTATIDAAKRYGLKFDEFHELKIVDGINVDYHCDPSRAGEIEFDADDQVALAVIFTPGKGKLSISLASRDSSYSALPTVKVYSSFLSSVKNEGDSTLRVFSPAPCPKFNIRLIGNGAIEVFDCKCTELNASIISGHGSISIDGNATTAKLSLTGGAGDIKASGFKASEVSAVVNGTGSISCHPLAKLSVGGIGSGKISYLGTPEIKKKFISTVKLIPLSSPTDQSRP